MRTRLLCYLMALSLLIAVGCEKDFYNIFGVDTDAPIELECYGSRFEFDGTKFSSNTGYFKPYNHPEIRIFDDGGFGFDLQRYLVSSVGMDVDFEFDIDYEDSEFELDRVYTLKDVNSSRAAITFYEYGATTPLPGGALVTDIITHSYVAVDGWIIFTKQEEYGSDYLLSGEFSFRGVSESGDEIKVRNGSFADCRTCFADEDGCKND